MLDSLEATIKILEAYIAPVLLVLQVFVAVLMYKISRRQVNFQVKEIQDRKTPFLYPISNHLIKDEWIRIYKGSEEPGDFIKSKEYETLAEDEKMIVEQCLRNTNKVFFTHYNKEHVIVINHAMSDNHIVIDHHNMIMTLKNFGATITKIRINELQIEYRNKKKKTLTGVIDNYCTDIVSNGGEIKFIIDEGTNDFEDSICKVTAETYVKLKDYEQFTVNANITTEYKKLLFDISLWNQYNDKFDYFLKLENRNGVFFREVIPKVK